jgi:cell wall-associated NlpC family hydrolase
MTLTQEAYDAFKHDVASRYPEEACGLLVGGVYHACKNALPNFIDSKTGTEVNPRLTSFRIDGTDRLRLHLSAGPIEAVLHSHPYSMAESHQFYSKKYDPVWPSVEDQQGFIDDDVPWGIVATDGEGLSTINWLVKEPIPFASRKFAWFTSDCFACVRDWYHVNTTFKIPNFTREWEFWTKGENTIEEGLRTIPNAVRLPASEAQVGDTAVFALGSNVVNHLAVITGPNEILHQFVNRYANFDRWDKWAHRAAYVVRLLK